MSLTPCRECGNQVSEDAAACPKCGAKLRQPMSRVKLLFGTLFALVVGSCVVGMQRASDAREAHAAAQREMEAKQTPEQRAAATAEALERSAQKAKEDEELATALIYLRTIREKMKNPKSFELSKAVVTDAGTYCFEYRGTNSFNAVVPNYAVIPAQGKGAIGTGGDVAAAWNAHCAKKPGRSLDRLRQVL